MDGTQPMPDEPASAATASPPDLAAFMNLDRERAEATPRISNFRHRFDRGGGGTGSVVPSGCLRLVIRPPHHS